MSRPDKADTREKRPRGRPLNVAPAVLQFHGRVPRYRWPEAEDVLANAGAQWSASAIDSDIAVVTTPEGADALRRFMQIECAFKARVREPRANSAKPDTAGKQAWEAARGPDRGDPLEVAFRRYAAEVAAQREAGEVQP
ncbi:MAG: hypothetical protein H0X64_14840 [Gemmatimonadaceae bacterium]|nr:hypothetical protein [Gemmatimonadaceae bacterium]